MAALNFRKLMKEELRKAKKKALKSNASIVNPKTNDTVNPQTSNQDDNDDGKFMQTELNFAEQLTRLNATIHKLPNCRTAYYIPNFLSSEFEQHLLSLIYSAPKSHWTALKRRRLQCYGGQADKYDLSKFNKDTLPLYLQQLCDKMSHEASIFTANHNEANHVLINEYQRGQGIIAHQDGPLYYGRVAIISLLSTLCISFYKRPPLKNNNTECPATHQLILEPQSCLVFEYDLYRDLFHTIHECTYDVIDENVRNLHCISQQELQRGDTIYRKDKRVSLTIRHVYDSNALRCIDLALEWLTVCTLQLK